MLSKAIANITAITNIHNIGNIINNVPNIVDISYGRDVGYSFTKHDLGKEIHDISATKIREQMREV